jgi:hypothetical protein
MTLQSLRQAERARDSIAETLPKWETARLHFHAVHEGSSR